MSSSPALRGRWPSAPHAERGRRGARTGCTAPGVSAAPGFFLFLRGGNNLLSIERLVEIAFELPGLGLLLALLALVLEFGGLVLEPLGQVVGALGIRFVDLDFLGQG